MVHVLFVDGIQSDINHLFAQRIRTVTIRTSDLHN
jgi:hypothetical protein